MTKALTVNLEKCTGCRSCELACSFKHHGEYNPAMSNIQVSIFTDEAFYVPVVCFQCDKPFCAEVCPTGAVSASTVSGAYIVGLDRAKFVGCKMCTLACPFGAISYHGQGKVHKCDLCGGSPECVVFCVPGALEFKEPEKRTAQKGRAFAEKMLKQRGVSQ
jgi:anaerobic carbon-monoxide dehydrogenase iron sulfur subunit